MSDPTATDPAADAPAPEPDADAASLRAVVADLNDQLLRRAAEFQNYRRRTESERGQAEARGRERVLLPVLDVYDDLRRSLDAARRQSKQDDAPSQAFSALAEGVELVYRKFETMLAQMGVEAIQAVGEPFDEAEHEAMMQQPAPEEGTPSGTVLAEIQPGYRMGDRVLRHARVIVAQ